MGNETAWIFCVGRELLEGLVLDRNATFLAQRLSHLGIKVQSIQIVDGIQDELVQALRAALANEPAYVFSTGGMGPHHDDITKDAVAEVAGVGLVEDAKAVDVVERAYRRLFAQGVVDNPALTDARLRMARVPAGSRILDNPLGAGPGCVLNRGGTRFVMLPGVPEELQRLFTLHVVPLLQAEGIGIARKTRQIDYAGRDESAIAKMLADHARRFPGVSSRILRGGTDDRMRISLFGEHTDARELDALLDQAEADLRARLGLELAGDRPGAAAGGSSE